MTPTPNHPEPPPFGSWPRTYWLVVAAATLVMLLLWLLTATQNHAPGAAR
jgi:hypothetical protein